MSEPLKDLRDGPTGDVRPDESVIITGQEYLQLSHQNARLSAYLITPDDAAAILKVLPRLPPQQSWMALEQKLHRIADSDPLPLQWPDDAARERAEDEARRLGPHPHARPGGRD